MRSEYEFQRQVLTALKSNRLQFVEKMDTILILNTNVISKRLHSAVKQQIQAKLSADGQFCANSLLFDQLCKFDSGGVDLSEAFRETKYKGPHRDLALILQKAMIPSCDSSGHYRSTSSAMVPSRDLMGSNRESSSVTKSQASQSHKKLSRAVQEQVDHMAITELTSHQREAEDIMSTSGNETTQLKLMTPFSDVNKNKMVVNKKGKDKEMQTLLDNPIPMEDTELKKYLTTNSEPMSESFFITDSQISDDTVHEIDNLKLLDIGDGVCQQTFPQHGGQDSLNSQTLLKQVKSDDDCETGVDESGCECNSTKGYSRNSTEVKTRIVENEQSGDTNCETVPKVTGSKYENGGNTTNNNETDENSLTLLRYDPQDFVDIQSAKNSSTEKNSIFMIMNESENGKEPSGVSNRDTCIGPENMFEREAQIQNPTTNDSNNLMPAISRIHSCPPIGAEEVNISIDEFESSSGNERFRSLGKVLSQPATEISLVSCNNLFIKRRLSACKGVAGNL